MAAAKKTHDRAALVIFAFLLFFVMGLGSLQFSGFQDGADEGAHLSYAFALRDHHFYPPELNTAHMYDLSTRQPIERPNYINHPATGYYPWAAAIALDRDLSLQGYRAISLVIGLAAFAVFLRIGNQLLGTREYAFYALFPLLLWFPVLFGVVSPDVMVTTGGFCTAYGWLKWDKAERHWFPWLLGGFLLASVKLNSLLLVSFYCAYYLVLAMKRQRLWQLHWFIPAAGMCYLPYLIFWCYYGSPAPETPSQADAIHGREVLNIPDFFHYVCYALRQFAFRHVVPFSWLIAGIFLLLFACILRQLALFTACKHHRPSTPMTTIMNATVLAFFATFTIHLLFSYHRYLVHHWGGDFYARYYMPLLPGFSLLFASALGQIGGLMHKKSNHG